MILLDTDHLSTLRFHGSVRAERLRGRLEAAAADGPVGTTVANVEETMKGWLSSIAKERLPQRQIGPYRELAQLFDFFGGFAIVLFDQAAADQFASYSRIRIGTQDRKIAAITVVNPALLLTANRQHFGQIPGLRFENWLDG